MYRNNPDEPIQLIKNLRDMNSLYNLYHSPKISETDEENSTQL